MKSVVVLFIFCAIIVQGQESQPYGKLANSNSVREEMASMFSASTVRYGNIYGFDNKYKGIYGTPFYRNRWCEGTLKIKGLQEPVSDDNYRYKFDGYQNEIWVFSGTDSLILQSKDIDWFELNCTNTNDFFTKLPQADDKNRFFRQIFKGNLISVYEDVNIILKKSNYVNKGMYTSGDPYDKFVPKSTYCYITDQNKLIEFKPSVKDVSSQFSKVKSNKIKKYCKENNIKGKLTEIQIHQIFTYIDTL